MKYNIKPHSDIFSPLFGGILLIIAIILTMMIENL